MLTSKGQIFTASPVRRIWGKRSRIALKIYEHVPANNVYTVVKFVDIYFFAELNEGFYKILCRRTGNYPNSSTTSR
jgi:hypothetical protein